MHLALLIGKTYSFYRPEAKPCSVGGHTKCEVRRLVPTLGFGGAWGTPCPALGSLKSTRQPLGVFSSPVMAFGFLCPFLWQVEGLAPGCGRRWCPRWDGMGAAAPFPLSPFPVAPDVAEGRWVAVPGRCGLRFRNHDV